MMLTLHFCELARSTCDDWKVFSVMVIGLLASSPKKKITDASPALNAFKKTIVKIQPSAKEYGLALLDSAKLELTERHHARFFININFDKLDGTESIALSTNRVCLSRLNPEIMGGQ